MNAIIMAAGTSSRFVPLSYEKPKGLLVVKNEVLIERQIKQLLEAGITDITIVVGYKASMFQYLVEKYGVSLVLNDDYAKYNNTSSLIRVLDKLGDTYICSSDNYFTRNVFLGKATHSYYSALYSEQETNEYCIQTDKSNNICSVTIGGKQTWYMIGHVFFNRDFSSAFASLLSKEYLNKNTRYEYWEDVYIRHISELPPMQIHKFSKGEIKEFDSLEELRDFDPTYTNSAHCSILDNICNVLHCKESDIIDIYPLKNGMTNRSFVFTCFNKQYVYRHPGEGTEVFINRESEYFSMQIAKQLNIDSTFIYMHPQEGWKISYYIPNAHALDYNNPNELQLSLNLLRTLHQANIQSKHSYRLWEQAEIFLTQIQKCSKESVESAEFHSLYNSIKKLHQYTMEDAWGECLNHCDALADNFLCNDKGEMTLIDWEYSGQGDTAQDIGSFIACSPMNYNTALCTIQQYLQKEATKEELRHYIAYVAIASFTWFLWAIYQNCNGVDTGEYLAQWQHGAQLFGDKALSLYES
ncbi:MAG TPA: choline kinase [Bacteroidales bacterium]|nr:choline kinase [Bacteroidales bacterium]